MKIRTGFVSNSSSSSFTCCVCGEEASGMDMGLRDAGMFECVNGHTCCNSHLIKTKKLSIEEKRKFLIDKLDMGYNKEYYTKHPDEKLKQIDEYNSEDFDIEDAYEDVIQEFGCAEENCPICSFKNLDSDDALNYLYRKYSISGKEVLAEMKKQFSNYSELKQYINSK